MPEADENDIKYFIGLIQAEMRSGRTLDESVSSLGRRLASDMQSALNEAEKRIREEQNRIGKMRRPRTLNVPGIEPWYTGPEDNDNLWWRYREKLENVHCLPSEAVDDIDEATTRTLSLMSPPGFSRFNTRGLVIGYVQSGKTANYIGLIAKAAEAGYRFIIVLTGTIEALRRQTQERIQNDLVNLDDTLWLQLTSSEFDFKRQGNVNAYLSENTGALPLAVVKKNKDTLGNLLKWIGGARDEVLRNLPVLVIDDEADQASINTKKDEERTTINQLILDLLNVFPKAAYVGYTATPFANVLIDPHIPGDLYPRDFIVDLPVPKGYFGPEQIFGREPLSEDEAALGLDGMDLIRTIPDDEAELLKKRNKSPENFAATIPAELRHAVLYFWLATAARRVRGHTDAHCTMLIHTSELAADHDATKPLIEAFHENIQDTIDNNYAALREELLQIWKDETTRVPPQADNEKEVSFEDLESHFPVSLNETQIICENHKSEQRLDYSKPRQVAIVIGGNVLSRGLTLEGLLVSYFSRSAGAYDTLLQMGRWFGFRNGYTDLPRIWMTERVEQLFRDLATVEEELRRDTQRYEYEGLTPMEFAPRIRRHPALNITSPTKMQYAEQVERSYEGRRLQTILFHHRNKDWLEGNLKAAKNLLVASQQDSAAEQASYGWVLAEVDHRHILSFLQEYRFHENSRDLDSELLQKYIRSRVDRQDSLRKWNVVVMPRSKEDSELGTLDLGINARVPLINRARMRLGPDEDTANIKALVSRPDVVADLPEKYEAYNGESPQELVEFRSREYPDIGCLLLYPIARNSRPRSDSKNGSPQRAPLDAVDDVIGAAFVFPSTLGRTDTPQTYYSAPLRPEDTIDYLDSEDINAEVSE